MSLPHYRLASRSQAHVLLTRLQPQRRRIFRIFKVVSGSHTGLSKTEGGTSKIEDALEWITLKQQSGAYLIQHYGLVRTGEVIQHFTETWSLLQDGRWRQDVGPSRYTCISEVRMGQLHCSSPGAAKPTRDQREVYDLLNRVSTIQITPKGWVQSEMNDKVTKEGKVVATEVGWVEYRRTADDSPCDVAKKLYPSE
jgi:hypothetical protein